MSLVLHLPRKMHHCRSSSNVPRLPPAIVFGNATKPSRFAHFSQGAQSRLPRETTSQRPKIGTNMLCFHILTSKCASRHDGVHLFEISTSKSGPTLVCFVHFDFETLLRATTACNFSTSQLPKVARSWCVLYSLTSKCASRHNGVPFLSIFHLSSGQMGPHPPL